MSNLMAVKPAATGSAPEELVDRLVLPMVNEAVKVWEDSVVEDLDLLDAGIIFGTGFAPFRGGPINYAKARGVAEVLAALNGLQERHGERFKPAAGWEKLAG